MSKQDDKTPVPQSSPPAEPSAPRLDASLVDAIALAAGIAAKSAVTALRDAGEGAPRKAGPVNLGAMCSLCLQALKACRGKHRKAIVFPQHTDPKFFQGVTINGINYRSDHRGHLIWVPEDVPVENMVAMWEQGESRFNTARIVEHHSGSLTMAGDTPNTAGFKPAVGF